jgi:hypothetical protein
MEEDKKINLSAMMKKTSEVDNTAEHNDSPNA